MSVGAEADVPNHAWPPADASLDQQVTLIGPVAQSLDVTDVCDARHLGDGILEEPLFGIGFGQFAEESSDVAHNSYLHTYAELGFFGGTLFFGSFFLALDSMRRIDTNQQSPAAEALTQLRPCVAGLIAGYATGVFSLSRPYMVPTYLVFGLGASFMYLATSTGQLKLRFDRKLMTRLTGASAACLVGIYVLVKVFVRFG